MFKSLTLFYCVFVLLTVDMSNKQKFEYCDALTIHQNTGRPMVVVLSASWCKPCDKYHKNVIDDFAKMVDNGETDYLLAIVDIDKYPNLAKVILNGDRTSVPYTAIYYKSGDFCHKRKLCGYDPKKELFIEELKIIDGLRNK